MRRRIIILGTVVLVVLLGWTGAWFWAAGEVRRQVTMLAEADGIETPRVTCGTLNVAGFPFRLDLTCAKAVAVQGDQTATLPELRATVLVYNPFHLQVYAKGPLDIADAFTGTKRRLGWKSLEASVRLADWRIARASVVMDEPAWTDTLAGELLLASAEHAEFHLIDIPEQHDKATATAALAAYATVAGANATDLGIAGGEATLEAEVTGLPDDVRAFGDPDALRRWQAAGGALKVVTLKGSDADQSFDVSGALSLDSAGRADGQVNLASNGIVEHVSEFVPAELRGLILGAPAADGSYSQTVTLRSGIIFSGIMPAGMIPPLW